MSTTEDILLVGTGNLASHLAGIFSATAGYSLFVASREAEKGSDFCARYGGLLYQESDNRKFKIVLLCVSDSALIDCAAQYAFAGDCLVHTSGSSSLELIDRYHPSTGVFWPLQTFTAGRPVSWNNLPVCIQGKDPFTKKILRDLVFSIGAKMVESTSESRLKLHIAAVFACNFVNHMYVLSDIWCRENLLSFELLKPLIEETASKVQEILPPEAQTGPAKRGDNKINEKHLATLSDHPALQTVYNLLAKQIHNRYR